MNAFPSLRLFHKYAIVFILLASKYAVAAVPPDVCANIAQLGIDKQVNARAAEILASCGLSPAPAIVVSSPATTASTNTIGGTDQNLIDSTGNMSPNVTQSETQVWAEQDTIVVTYNDSRTAPSCYGGGSYSQDRGVTWNNLTSRPFCNGHGTNYGDPFVVYDQSHSVWLAGFLATGCGGQGIGIWKSTDAVNWTPAPCAHSGFSDDRESAWVDNNPASPHYGRVYVTWNDFTLPSYNISVVYSDNGGENWSNAVVVSPSPIFYRNVQVTTGQDGTVFIASMNEGNGGLTARSNLVFRSSNGGIIWDQINMGPSFPAAGTSTCGYFATMFSPNIWRHMGWGDIAAGPNGTIHYVYTQHGIPESDVADIYYSRSTDNGISWEPGIKLNTDANVGWQWQASVAVSPEGHVLVSWYDTRTQLTSNYERWGRFSSDNGQTWEADAPISDASSPLPLQLDPYVNPCYTGDYDRSFFSGGAFLGTWVDGRGPLINGNAQQDVFFDQVADNVSPPPPPPPPTDIVLSAIGYKVKGIETIDLSWAPSGSGNTMNILRDTNIIANVADSGSYTDSTGVKGNKGLFEYQVCIEQTAQCSNVVTISFTKN